MLNFRTITCRISSVVIKENVRRSNCFQAQIQLNLTRLASTMAQNGEKATFQKLPTHSRPTNYNITLKTDLESFQFTGKQQIKVKVLESTTSFTLHSKDLKIESASVSGPDGEQSGTVSLLEKEEKAQITFAKPLAAGDVLLDMQFTGPLNDSMRGYYRSKYTPPGATQPVYMASTQFESTYARMAFPCWDEPIYKATFDVTLTVKEEYTALSNAKQLSETKEGGWKAVTFETTPIMSSYLVAFAVGDFKYVETNTKEGINVRVYTVPHNIGHTAFALDCAKRALEYYNEFFGIVYPIPKCDLIAIPDFSMGAMENWGLVTYREVLLLVDPKRTSQFIKSRVALVIAHELAHMWFGDLVTMKWWTDLWLKEGFATFMEYLFVDYAYPEFEIMTRFVNDELVRGLSLDALKSSHPIEVDIEDPNELEEIYDSITYAKASSVNRMLYSHVGHDTFQAGLRAYLQKYQYSNATTADLWAALGDAAKQDVASLMSSWTRQMGFPMLDVDVKHEGGKCVLSLKQSRFLADGTVDEAPVWRVPVTVLSAANPDQPQKFILADKAQTFELQGVNKSDWVKLNAGMTAYYRTKYSDGLAAKLLDPLKQQTLGAADRFNLISDMLALLRAGRAPVGQLLDVLSAISGTEQVLICWNELDSAVGKCANVLQYADDKQLLARYKKFIVDQYTPLGEKLGWEPAENEAPQRLSLRALILSRLGRCGHQPTIAQAQQLFKANVDGGKELQADLRRVVYDIVAINGGAEAFERMANIVETAEFPEVQRNALISLGASLDTDVQQKALEYTIKSGKVRKQDMLLPFVTMSRSAGGQQTLWQYFKQHMHDLVQLYDTANSSLFQHIMQISIEGNCTETVAAEAEALIKASPYAATLDRPMRQSVEEVRLNAALLKREQQRIADWLTAKGY